MAIAGGNGRDGHRRPLPRWSWRASSSSGRCGATTSRYDQHPCRRPCRPNLGDSYLADYEALLSLNSGIASIDGMTVEGVLVYDGTLANGKPSANCFDAAGTPFVDERTATTTPPPTWRPSAATDCSVACSIFPNNSNCLKR
ncbi:MAG: hypothetical protein R2695_04440 [Acidimicrobiales bacterium]